jgi:hypothetical protein
MAFSHYDEVPNHIAVKIIDAEKRKEDSNDGKVGNGRDYI